MYRELTRLEFICRQHLTKQLCRFPKAEGKHCCPIIPNILPPTQWMLPPLTLCHCFPLHNCLMSPIWCLQLLGLKSFRTGAVMLAGLLLYDVFWVFGSKSVIGDNVMLTVATSDIVSGPTRLLFPRIAGGTGEASNFPFSLLGESTLSCIVGVFTSPNVTSHRISNHANCKTPSNPKPNSLSNLPDKNSGSKFLRVLKTLSSEIR